MTDDQQRAEQHRPNDQESLIAVMRSMEASGLKARDISMALNIGLGAVLQALDLQE